MKSFDKLKNPSYDKLVLVLGRSEVVIEQLVGIWCVAQGHLSGVDALRSDEIEPLLCI